MEQRATSYTDNIEKPQTLSERLNRNKVEQLCFKGDLENPQPVALTFVQTNGVQDSFKYMQLMGERYMPGKGVILFYSQATVTITGYQLDILFKHITQQKVALVTIYDVPYQVDKLEKNEAIVKSITVDYHDPAVEKRFSTLEKTTFIRNGHANDQKSENKSLPYG